MTCIVAVEYEGGVVMASDSFIGNEESAELSAEPKISERDGIAIGFCGGVLITTWLSGIKIPSRKRAHSPRDYVSQLAMGLRSAAIEARVAGSDGESSPSSGSLLLVACGGQAWVVQPDFSVYRSAHGYTSIGSGAAYALGSLTTTRGAPRHRARAAIQAAIRHCPSVRAPIHIVEVPA
jgi:ATP-dependent protease HslVU (ClpYQ) peptidase subunit